MRLLYSEGSFKTVTLSSTLLFAADEIMTGRRGLVEGKNLDLWVTVVVSLIFSVCDFGEVVWYKWGS